MNFPPHPGKIKMVDLSTGSEKDVPYEQAPDHSRFVYLDKNGAETFDLKQAVERIPIVLVEMMPVDDHGNLTQRDKAKMLRIEEFGPERRPLRSTTLLPDKK